MYRDTKLKLAFIQCKLEQLHEASNIALKEIEEIYSEEMEQFIETFYNDLQS